MRPPPGGLFAFWDQPFEGVNRFTAYLTAGFIHDQSFEARAETECPWVSSRLRLLYPMRRSRMVVVQVGSQMVSDDIVTGRGHFEKVFLHVAGKVRPQGERGLAQ